MNRSDGSTADYYVLPDGATQLQDLISHRNMNAQIGEIIRACYRYGMASHSDMLRDAKKIRFYAQAEVERLEKLEATSEQCGQAEDIRKTGGPIPAESTYIVGEQPSEFLVPSVWKGAPKWAMWLAEDDDGSHWYESEPVQNRTFQDEWNYPLSGRFETINEVSLPLNKYQRPK